MEKSDAATPGDLTDREKAEEALRESEKRFRTSLDCMMEGCQLVGFDWRYLYLNDAAAIHNRRPNAEILGGKLTEVWPGIEATAIFGMLRRAMEERVALHEETEFVFPDGSKGWFDVRCQPVPEGLFILSIDIGERKSHERELERLNRLYAALGQINQAIVRMPSRDELFQKVCQVLVEHGGFRMAWFGLPSGEGPKLTPVAEWGDENDYLRSIAVYTDDRPEGHGPAGTAFREGRTVVSNDMLNDPAMLPWWVEAGRRGFQACAGFPIRLKSAVCGALMVYATEPGFFQDKEIALIEEAASDVSFALDNFAREEERRRAEAVAQQEMHFSGTMIESLPGVIYFYNEAGRFLRWNRNFETVTGYSAEEIARMQPPDFFRGDDKRRVRERIAEVFAEGESTVEACFIAKDGRGTPYFFTGKHIVFNGEECVVGMGIDITERVRAEEQLKTLNLELEDRVRERTAELEKVNEALALASRAKSQFLATMSHELRTPMNAIIGFTGTLLMKLPGPLTSEQEKQLNIIRASGRHLLSLINDLLDLSKVESGKTEMTFRPVIAQSVIAEVVTPLRPLATKKGLEFQDIAPVEDITLRTDRRALCQILINLVNNAIKFTDHGSVSIELRLAAGAVEFIVADTGIGMAPEDRVRLFSAFMQIDDSSTRAYEGTGLGLHLSQKLAELLGGAITVESELGKGSRFVLTVKDAAP
jgi:PAS domain S-box-containing protein